MKFQIYKITNKVNGKIYVGQHSCKCEECFYMGSGHGIARAKLKYGLDSFVKEILFEFDTFEEMNSKEAEIVNEEFVSRKDTYNIRTGGFQGGAKHTTETKAKISASCGKNISPEGREKIASVHRGKTISEKQKQAIRESNARRKISDETRRKLSECAKNRSDETKERIAASLKGKSKGRKHSPETIRKRVATRKMNALIKKEKINGKGI
jgi:group I intron endonuclease